MRSITVLFLVLILSCTLIGESDIWSASKAVTLPKKRIEFGVFQPLRYGFRESVELSTHPLTDFLMPNIALKKGWPDLLGLWFATRHTITYPTPLLRVISREATGGVLPADAKVPHIITLNNQVMFTKKLTDFFTVTGKGGAVLAAKIGDEDMATIDYPIIYPRTAVYHSQASFNLGIDFTGNILPKLEYLLDVDLFITRLSDGPYAIEHKGLIIWKKSRRFSACLGYKLMYGAYPFGNQLDVMPFYNLPVPLIDLQWGLN